MKKQLQSLYNKTIEILCILLIQKQLESLYNKTTEDIGSMGGEGKHILKSNAF